LLSLRPALIIDGLFGVGLNRALDANWSAVLEEVNASRRKVLAVDVPSGLNADTGVPQPVAIRASVTITVGAPKLGLLQRSAWEFAGRIEVADQVGLIAPSIRSEMLWTTANDFDAVPPERPAASHKGTFGHAALIAGSRGFHGASVLAARGAQRAQPGLITLHTMEGVYDPVASQLQAVMVSPWTPRKDYAEKFSALLIGPGLAAEDLPPALEDETAQLWRECPLPMIVDASALSWLPSGQIAGNYVRLITPHPGEAARLLNVPTDTVQADRVKAVRELSKKFGHAWVVLKGHQTLVGRESGEIYVNSTGNPRLAQGGSGDLLSGYLVGLLAQQALQSDPGLAIRYAVWQHGAAADHLTATRPNWIIEDLSEVLGLPLAELYRARLTG
jgi:NAD(P)H-hydrate epimerase